MYLLEMRNLLTARMTPGCPELQHGIFALLDKGRQLHLLTLWSEKRTIDEAVAYGCMLRHFRLCLQHWILR